MQQAVKERTLGVFSSDLYHLTASGVTSWCGFAEETVDLADRILSLQLKTGKINSISTAQYLTPAKRPMSSQLALKKLESVFNVKMPGWKEVLALCTEELNLGEHLK